VAHGEKPVLRFVVSELVFPIDGIAQQRNGVIRAALRCCNARLHDYGGKRKDILRGVETGGRICGQLRGESLQLTHGFLGVIDTASRGKRHALSVEIAAGQGVEFGIGSGLCQHFIPKPEAHERGVFLRERPIEARHRQ
jgi:hypothetical protein